jgi:hypothetical protein
MCLIIADVTRQTKEGGVSQWGHTDADVSAASDNGAMWLSQSMFSPTGWFMIGRQSNPIIDHMSMTMTQSKPTQTPWPSGDLKGAQPWSHKWAAHSLIIHSEFKTISPYLFPLKSWVALNPEDQNHINPQNQLTGIKSVPKKGDASPWNHIRAQLVPCGDKSTQAPMLTEKGSVKEWYSSQACILASIRETILLPWKQLRTPSSTQSLSSLQPQ